MGDPEYIMIDTLESWPSLTLADKAKLAEHAGVDIDRLFEDVSAVFNLAEWEAAAASARRLPPGSYRWGIIDGT